MNLNIRKNTFVHILIVLLATLTFIHISSSLLKIFNSPAPDFQGFTEATSYLFQHQNAYNFNGVRLIIIPPVSALQFLPFLFIPYNISQALFVMLNAFSVPIILILCQKLISKKVFIYQLLLFLSLTFLSFPTKFTLGMGQVNLIALFLLILGFYLYKKERVVVSGVVTATAFLIKPILLFVVLFFIYKRAWRTLFAILTTTIIFLSISVMLFGINIHLYYITEVVPNLLGVVTAREVYYNQGLMGFISRLTPDLFLRSTITQALSIGLLGFFFLSLRLRQSSDNYIFSGLLTLLLIVHTLAWQHHFVMLIFPFVYLAYVLTSKKEYLLLSFLLLGYLLVSWNFKNPSIYSDLPLSLLLSNNFYGALIIFILLVIVHRKHHKKVTQK